MKAIIALIAAVSAHFVAAHHTLPDFIDWTFIRETANHYSNGPVTNVNDPEFRCYELDLQNTQAASTGTATVSAGSTVGFKAVSVLVDLESWPIPNLILFYPTSRTKQYTIPGHGMSIVLFSLHSPAANSAQAGRQLTFPSQNIQSFTFTIPKSLPSGQYLIRAEQIALHAATNYGGAQLYISCAQVNIVNGVSLQVILAINLVRLCFSNRWRYRVAAKITCEKFLSPLSHFQEMEKFTLIADCTTVDLLDGDIEELAISWLKLRHFEIKSYTHNFRLGRRDSLTLIS
ncbi:Endo-beta-1,4-glucanase D [Abortiporus biennis]